MKKLILGISIMASGILLICAAIFAGGLIAANTGVTFLDVSYADNHGIVWIVVIGAMLTISGLVLSLMDVFGKKQ